MANVNITFNGKEFLLSCDDGQEENLVELANHLNSKYTKLNQNLGNIGENKLLLITAIKMVDDYFDLFKKVKSAKGYGILQVKHRLPSGYLVGGVEEKPVKPKSNLGILALYYFTPEIFSSLKKTKRGKNNEIQLTDGIQRMINDGKKVIAIELTKDDIEIDVGTVESYRNAQISSYKIA